MFILIVFLILLGVGLVSAIDIDDNSDDYILNENPSLLVSSVPYTAKTPSKISTIVKAPKVTSKYNKNTYFKVTVKDKSNKNPIKGLKLKLKVFTGKKYKTYTVKTNSKGVAKFKTKELKIGTHKVLIKSADKRYSLSSKSSIVIKKTPTKRKGYYVASRNSDKFHYSSCASAKRIKSYNRITFSSRSSAINQGYRPCARCHP
ncbi:Metal binding domain of Ada [Methanobrevibacter olleyae]|uniref:Metal binding domain of Ada n=1 Tax=Methanobrevibacter olleyae TaxID=294671 RepID=A0A1I4GSW7_METOL|nr:Ada metal-binding domain-containing protein [Methanobrevibacter olleyae]SFL33104.1 Metal binding domain of Ada [Methanobrevibacter olleyae]